MGVPLAVVLAPVFLFAHAFGQGPLVVDHDDRTVVLAVSAGVSEASRRALLDRLAQQGAVLSGGFVEGLDGEAYVVFRPDTAVGQVTALLESVRLEPEVFGQGYGAYVANPVAAGQASPQMGMVLGERVLLADGVRYWVERTPPISELHYRGWDVAQALDLEVITQDAVIEDLTFGPNLYFRVGGSFEYSLPYFEGLPAWHVSDDALGAGLTVPPCDPSDSAWPVDTVCRSGDLIGGASPLVIGIALLPETGGLVECGAFTSHITDHPEHCVAVHNNAHVGWHPIHYFLRHYFALYGEESCEVRLMQGDPALEFTGSGLADWGVSPAFWWVYAQIVFTVTPVLSEEWRWEFLPIVHARYSNRRTDPPLRSRQEIEAVESVAPYPQENALDMVSSEIVPALKAFMETGDVRTAMQRLNYDRAEFRACQGRS